MPRHYTRRANPPIHRFCIDCHVLLCLGQNWTVTRGNKRHYICRTCAATRHRQRKQYIEARTTTIKRPKNRSPLEKRLAIKCRHTMYSAERRQMVWDISTSFFLETCQKPCCYCGAESTILAPTGLDRIDSNIGYIESNVQPCCTRCNRAKNTMLEHEFIQHCRAIIKYFEGRSHE